MLIKQNESIFGETTLSCENKSKILLKSKNIFSLQAQNLNYKANSDR